MYLKKETLYETNLAIKCGTTIKQLIGHKHYVYVNKRIENSNFLGSFKTGNVQSRNQKQIEHEWTVGKFSYSI